MFKNQEKERGVIFVPVLIALAIAGTGWSFWEWAKGGVTNGFLGAIAATMVNFAGACLTWASQWLTYVLSPSFTTKPIVGFNTFDQAWGSMRDISNMAIVLGFVVVGIATTLRISQYEAKKLLPLLIAAAVLVNFSGVFCGAVIYGSNLTQTALLQQGSANGMFSQLTNMIGNWAKGISNNPNGGLNPSQSSTDFLTAAALAAIIELFSAWIFIILAVLLAARYAVLACLYILSPLAVVAYVFPATNHLSKKWIHEFFNWSLLGVTTGFFIYLGMSFMITGMGAGGLDFNILFVGFIFFYIAYKMARGTSAMGAGAVIGLTTAAATKALGMTSKATSAAGGLALSKLADSRVGQKVSNAYGRSLEAIGVRKAGSTAASKQGKLNEDQKGMDALIAQGDLARVQRIAEGKGAPGFRHTTKQRAAATAALLKSGNFNPDNPEQIAGLNYFQSEGGNLGEFSKKDPRLARYDISATKNTMTKNPGISEAEAQQRNVEGSYARLGVRGMRDLPANAMDLNFIASVDHKKNGKASDEYSRDQIERLKKYKDHTSQEFIEQDMAQTLLRASGDPEKIARANRIRDNIAEIATNPNFA